MRRPFKRSLTRGEIERARYLEKCRSLRNEPINRRIKRLRAAIRVGNLTTDQKDDLRAKIKALKGELITKEDLERWRSW